MRLGWPSLVPAALLATLLAPPGPVLGQDAPAPDPDAALLSGFEEKLGRVRAWEAQRQAVVGEERRSLIGLGRVARRQFSRLWEGELERFASPFLDPGALAQVRRAVAVADDTFGKVPAGTWTSVSEAWRREWGLRWATLITAARESSRRDLEAVAAREALRRDPENEIARMTRSRLFPDWRREHESRGLVYDDRAGWVPRGDTGRLDAGLLPFLDGWHPAEKVEERRRLWQNAWEVPWSFWRIRTNLPARDIRPIGQLLDMTWGWAMENVSGHFSLDVRGEVRVLVFAKREDYDEHARVWHRTYEKSLKKVGGFFSLEDRAAHALCEEGARDDRMPHVIPHEAAHALLAVSEPHGGRSGVDAGALLAEAIAIHAEFCGTAPPGFGARRLRAAAGWLPRVQKPRSLAALLAVRNADLYGSSASEFYPQGAALAGFFMESGDLRRREAFLESLLAMYRGTWQPRLLPKLLGRSPEEMEGDWSAWLAAANGGD
ncbi:MAG: hypothetical protein L0216_04815 [Planctomycetales bacterium]|nr:hypothetical protein [Planctomycetales bacterium]